MREVESVSKSPDYWAYAATVNHCNAVINRYQEEIDRLEKLVDEWSARRNRAIKLFWEKQRV